MLQVRLCWHVSVLDRRFCVWQFDVTVFVHLKYIKLHGFGYIECYWPCLNNMTSFVAVLLYFWTCTLFFSIREDRRTYGLHPQDWSSRHYIPKKSWCLPTSLNGVIAKNNTDIAILTCGNYVYSRIDSNVLGISIFLSPSRRMQCSTSASVHILHKKKSLIFMLSFHV
jgi:hypothetical protein